MLNIQRLTLMLSLFSLLMACTPVQHASIERDQQAKLFTIEPGKSHVYIFRNETENFNTTMSVSIDGIHVGDTEHRTYILKTLTPGKHLIKVHAENMTELEIMTEANKNHFIWLEVSLGLVIPRADLHLVNDEKGRMGVEQSQLVK